MQGEGDRTCADRGNAVAGVRQYTVGNDQYTGRVYGAGTKAYLDTLGAGLVPCVVLEVLVTSNGRRLGRDEVKIILTKTKGAYHAGTVLTAGAHEVPPRSQIRSRDGHYRVNVNYIYERNGDVEEAAGSIG